MNILPEDLRNWRQYLDMTQIEMADMLAVPASTYIKWEQGNRGTSTLLARHVCLLQWLEDKHPDIFADYINGETDV